MLPNFPTSWFNTWTTGAKWCGLSRMLADQVTDKAIQDSKHKIKPTGCFFKKKKKNPVCYAAILSWLSLHSIPMNFYSSAIKSPTLHNTALAHKCDKHSRATVLFGDATWWYIQTNLPSETLTNKAQATESLQHADTLTVFSTFTRHL